MKPILEIHNISKKFFIDHERPSYLSFRDRLANAFTKRSRPEEFWALRDVSFDVMPGDSIGIIGRNGAGKSTLLKILSRITPPTEGHIIARGRVASLLEVGTGFHQELTGRENIFMNGSILGMRRAEIKKRYDEIVDFSGVEKFLDTPLKHYSSGMQLRLAFAVAAHLEPEILIVDEVLAVGDYEFQKKCLGKMEEVSRGGRTLLFVSHNLEVIASLCKSGVLMDKGTMVAFDKVESTLDAYTTQNPLIAGSELKNLKRKGSGIITLQNFSLFSKDMNGDAGPPRSGSDCFFELTLNSNFQIDEKDLQVDLRVENQMGIKLFWLSTSLITSWRLHKKKLTFIVKRLPLKFGHFNVVLYLTYKKEVADWVREGLYFEIKDGLFYESGLISPINQSIINVDFSIA